MALFLCLECQKQISDKALSCTNCGAPVLIRKERWEITWLEKLNNLFNFKIRIVLFFFGIYMLLKSGIFN